MNSISNFLSASPEVTTVASLILATSFIAYLFWLGPAVHAIIDGLRQLTIAISQEPAGWTETKGRVREIIKKHPRLASNWLEMEGRVTRIPHGETNTYVMFGIPRDIWNPPTLLSRTFNLALAEAIPNILVGVGLLFTFFFLSLALSHATGVLSDGPTTAQIKDAIEGLLKAAGAKFLTSLAGLFSSILWTFFAKRLLAELGTASEQFLEALAKIVPMKGGELVMERQVQLIGQLKTNSDDLSGLTEELLRESREQTGTFKRFETDLAVSLASAINKSVAPQMEAMTSKLVAAIESLSEKLGSMNQEALGTMLADFSSMLQKTSETEMKQLQQTLQQLSDKLVSAGENIGRSGDGAGRAIDDAGAMLVSRVKEITDNLALGATNMEGAALSIKLAMNDLEITVQQASTMGERSVLFVNDALGKAGATVEQMERVSTGFAKTSEAMESVGGKIANVIDTVEELSREQRSVVLSVREVAPTALAAVERVTGVLQHAADQTLDVMQQTQNAMESTATALTQTVASITEGVTVYTEQVAELHRQMDGQLAKAVGSFDKGVNDLAESVEELAEVMKPKNRG